MAKRRNEYSDPGLGEKYLGKSKRVINRDGTFNVKREHTGDFFRDSFKILIEMSWTRFLLLIFGLYVLVNAFFALIYVLVGVEHLVGMPESSGFDSYIRAFYFSVQTFTTVGYGAISPMGKLTGLVSSIEALIGLMGFALATGLLYGRFSHAQAKLSFSKTAVIAPYKDHTALMFRTVNQRHNILMEMEATVIYKEEIVLNGNIERRYHSLPLTLNRVTFFPMNWTLVHVINPESPLFGKIARDIEQSGGEVLVLIKGFDESFGQTVYARYSYTFSEIEFNKVFDRMFFTNDVGDVMVQTSKLSDTKTI
jgi:inward rectifier potassium channel